MCNVTGEISQRKRRRRAKTTELKQLFSKNYSAPEQESNFFGFEGFHSWGQQQGMCMDFDGTQVKHYYQWCFTREEGLPPAIIADLWLHLFT